MEEIEFSNISITNLKHKTFWQKMFSYDRHKLRISVTQNTGFIE